MSEKFVEAEKISEALEGILSKKDEVRSNYYRVLLHISEENPEILYSKYDYLANLLDSENHYHRYISINLLANLAVVDVENKFEVVFEKYFSNLEGDRTMVAGQAALNAGKIAKVKPNLQTEITNRLLNIERTHKGKQIDLIKAYAIEALMEYFADYSDKNEILDFVRAQLDSKSPKTRKLSKQFLKMNNSKSE